MPILTPSRRKEAKQQNAPSFDLDEMHTFLNDQESPLKTTTSDSDGRREKFQEMYLPSNIVCSSTPSLDLPYTHTPVKSDKRRGLVGGLTMAIAKPVSALQHVLKMPEKPRPISTQTSEIEEIKWSKVLTSSEGLQLMQEKQKKREEKAKKKELNQQKRNQKRQFFLKSKTKLRGAFAPPLASCPLPQNFS